MKSVGKEYSHMFILKFPDENKFIEFCHNSTIGDLMKIQHQALSDWKLNCESMYMSYSEYKTYDHKCARYYDIVVMILNSKLKNFYDCVKFEHENGTISLPQYIFEMVTKLT